MFCLGGVLFFLFFWSLVLFANVFHHASCAPFPIRPQKHIHYCTHRADFIYIRVCENVLADGEKKNNTNLLCAPMTVLVLGTLGLWLELECVCMCVVSSLSFASHIIHIRFDSMHQIPIAWHICNKVSNTQNLIYSQFYDSIITNYFITQLNRSSSTFVPTSKRNKRKEK